MIRIPARVSVLILALTWSTIGHAKEYENVKVDKLLVSGTAYNGQPLSYMQTDRPEVTALVVTLRPGGSTGWHRHPVRVYAYMLEGELTVEFKDGSSHLFRKGEPIVEVTDLLHNGVNTGRGDAKLVVFYTGAVGVPNVIKEGDEERIINDKP
jgi:quercetin dioxygenase-like cupin family protein